MSQFSINLSTYASFSRAYLFYWLFKEKLWVMLFLRYWHKLTKQKKFLLNIYVRLYSRKNTSNVNISFHRFENQGRHTVHMHLLVWLQNLGSINLDRVRATVPNDDSQLAYLVRIVYRSSLCINNIDNNMIHLSSSNRLFFLFYFIKYIPHICRLIFYKHQINAIQILQLTTKKLQSITMLLNSNIQMQIMRKW